jgi:hypothetical protein
MGPESDIVVVVAAELLALLLKSIDDVEDVRLA